MERALGIVALFWLLFAGASPHPALAQERNLIEYSIGGYAEGDSGSPVPPMLLPPAVKIYESGRIVFLNERGVWEGQIEERRLKKLRHILARNKLLQKTQVLPVKKGEPLGYHGGIAYVRYLDGENEVIVAVLESPRRGPWRRLVDLLYSWRPPSYHSFVPKAVVVSIVQGKQPDGDAVPWPFKNELSLRGREDDSEVTLSDPRMVNFVLRHMVRGFSWLETITSEDGAELGLTISSVPGWFESEDLGVTLGFLAYEASKAAGKRP